ncbi:MAG TPA: helix-turn-helix domain-containing protein [Candidatus Akkermansia intestinavium]|nr:helix-turn-helix domain-containing protein [Candidatus Akkermansia intestinavium]
MKTEYEAGDELKKLMEPHMKEPFVTPILFSVALDYISKLVTEAAENRESGGKARWMNVRQLAEYFGMNPVTMSRKLQKPLEERKVHFIGKPGRFRYNVQDVEAFLTTEAEQLLLKKKSGKQKKPKEGTKV